MEPIKIGIVIYAVFGKVVKTAVAKITDPSMEIFFIEGVMEELFDKVNAAKASGAIVFLASGTNYTVLSHGIDTPIIKMHITTFEYLRAIEEASILGMRVVLPYYKNLELLDIALLYRLTGVEIIPLEFESPHNLKEELERMEPDIVMGGTLACLTADKLNIKSILVTPSEDTIINCIKEAKQIALTLRREKEKSQTMKAISDYTLNGIIAADSHGFVTLFNPAAENILMIKSKQVLGRKIKEVIPTIDMGDLQTNTEPIIGEIVTINSVEIILNRIPLIDNNKYNGCILIFQKVSDIIRSEQLIRAQNKQKGLVAKAKFSDIIGRSNGILSEIERAKIYAITESNILINGETGVGKELFAQSIHNYSLRHSEPFVAINCAAIPESLMESEFFGYEEGAFTGSKKGGKPGLFELANHGTIFLDEISEITRPVQARLLRVLQEKEVMRVGGERIIHVDVRVIAATNKRLEDKLADGFRDDLFYRLDVLSLDIPPLRMRDDDVLEIFLSFLSRSLNMLDYEEIINQKSIAVLKSYSWPGNIRELFNVSERFVVQVRNTFPLQEGNVQDLLIKSIGKERLCLDIIKNYNIEKITTNTNNVRFQKLLANLEKLFPGQKEFIAKQLGMSRTTLWRMTK